jgi:hypothetical protein
MLSLRVWQYIAQNPGLKPGQITRRLGMNHRSLDATLATLEKHGYLVSEQNSRLYIHGHTTERSIMTVADYLVKGMNLPPLENPPKIVNHTKRGNCVITGLPITEGYEIWDVIPDSVGDFLDLLPNGTTGCISETAARAIKGTWNLGSRIIFEDGTHFHPLIARDKKGERPCWSDLVRQLWQERRGQSVLMILTTDPKKRTWTKARIGTLGSATPVMIYDVSDSGLSSVQVIDWVVLLETLEIIEKIYSMGFSKNGIRFSLLREWSRVQSFGTRQIIDLDNKLKPLREKTEFAMAVLIAQKQEITENENPTEQPELF